VLLLYSRLAPGLVTRTVKKEKPLGATVLKQGSEQQQQQCKQSIPCAAAAMTGTFYTIHPTSPILHCTALHLLWQSCTETNKEEVRGKSGLIKLDQETWLCRTQLDDFLVKIWTILDHTRTRLNLVVKAILWNLW
jgi:hypothetical protein